MITNDTAKKLIENMLDKAEYDNTLFKHDALGDGVLKGNDKRISKFYFGMPIYFYLYRKLRSDDILCKIRNQQTQLTLTSSDVSNMYGYKKTAGHYETCKTIIAELSYKVVDGEICSISLVDVYPD